jgi:hypothetical protein
MRLRFPIISEVTISGSVEKPRRTILPSGRNPFNDSLAALYELLVARMTSAPPASSSFLQPLSVAYNQISPKFACQLFFIF